MGFDHLRYCVYCVRAGVTFVVSNFVFNRGCGVFLLRMMVAEMTVYACSEPPPPTQCFVTMYVVLLGVVKLANMETWKSEVE